MAIVARSGFDASRTVAERAAVAFAWRAVALEADAHYSGLTGRVAQLAHLLHPEAAADRRLLAIELPA